MVFQEIAITLVVVSATEDEPARSAFADVAHPIREWAVSPIANRPPVIKPERQPCELASPPTRQAKGQLDDCRAISDGVYRPAGSIKPDNDRPANRGKCPSPEPNRLQPNRATIPWPICAHLGCTGIRDRSDTISHAARTRSRSLVVKMLGVTGKHAPAMIAVVATRSRHGAFGLRLRMPEDVERADSYADRQPERASAIPLGALRWTRVAAGQPHIRKREAEYRSQAADNDKRDH